MLGRKVGMGYFFAVLCVVLWSFIPIVARHGQVTLDNIQFLFWSNTVSFIIILTIFTLNNGFRYQRLTWPCVFYVGFLGFLGCTLYYLFLYFGYASGNSIEVLLLQYTWPIFMILIASLFLKELITVSSVSALIIGFLGVGLIITEGDFSAVSFSSIFVSFLVLSGALSFAVFSVLIKDLSIEILQLVLLLFLGGFLSALILTGIFTNFALPSRSEVIFIFLNGALVNGVSYILWLLALRRISAQSAAMLVFLTPFLSSIWITFFLNGVWHSFYFLGGAFIMLSSFLSLRIQMKKTFE